jgi:hypothetical protein
MQCTAKEVLGSINFNKRLLAFVKEGYSLFIKNFLTCLANSLQ